MKLCRLVLLVLCLPTAGCQGLNMPSFSMPRWPGLNFRSQSPELEDDPEDEFRDTFRVPLIGDYTAITGLNLVTLEGVGLVTGLDGTGGDPAPSPYRTVLLNEMRRHNVWEPNRVLASQNTALVVVRAYLPPLVRKGETFDVEVRLPESANATSLAGGMLLETHLSEKAIVPGQGVLTGHELATAKGPILISMRDDDPDRLAGVLRRGRVLAGGHAKTDRDLAIYLRNDFRSIRNSRRIAARIGERFYGYDRYGTREPLAEPMTDQRIVLKVESRYRDNYPRYLQVIRNIAFREDEVHRRVRMERLKTRLMRPETAELAAIQLEAIGKNAVPILKSGLKSKIVEVRFHAAVALAYLGEPDGIDALAEAARDERAFRVFAMAALSTLDEAETHVALKKLMDETSVETRYGAFRALWTLDRNDPYIRGEDMEGRFTMHVVESESDEPLIHLTHHRRAELVLFGTEQRFRTPLALSAGNNIRINGRPGRDRVIISRYQVGLPDLRREVSADVAEVIRVAVEFGASYPDVAGMLVQAEKQGNLPGRIAIDELPQAGRLYIRPQAGRKASKSKPTRVGRNNQIPNMFPSLDDTEDQAGEAGENETTDNGASRPKGGRIVTGAGSRSAEASATGSASLTDAREEESMLMEEEPQDPLGRLFQYLKHKNRKAEGGDATESDE
jgi:hypothetical protein